MRPDLAVLLESAASLLDRAGPLEPLHVAVGGRDIRITFAPGVPLADQRAGVDRLATVTGSTPTHSNLGAAAATYTFSATLPGSLFLLVGTHPTIGRPRPRRSTSTRATAALLRTLAPWGRALSASCVDVTELTAQDDEERLTVQLIVESDGGDPRETLRLAAVGTTGLRRCREDEAGLGARGQLPSGESVMVSVV
ncbi:hypothetical protein OIE78_35285 (plasmid) [Streptomyces cellulosae]|uniref:hypothetical protein n=1 Tax=Streptomyces cellulosae TaxID=1968 RepID=UPI002F90C617|nr:hypothetical protein OG837_34935 [Streptomyces cellulosae]